MDALAYFLISAARIFTCVESTYHRMRSAITPLTRSGKAYAWRAKGFLRGMRSGIRGSCDG